MSNIFSGGDVILHMVDENGNRREIGRMQSISIDALSSAYYNELTAQELLKNKYSTVHLIDKSLPSVKIEPKTNKEARILLEQGEE